MQNASQQAMPGREMQLVLACCSVAAGRDAHIAAVLSPVSGKNIKPTDWNLFLQIVKRHRVSGLVFRALQDFGIPQDIRTALSQLAQQQTILASRLALETMLVQRILNRAGVPAVFPKGAALARRLYDDVAPRHSRDVDVFTTKDAICAAHAALLAEGYEQISPTRPFRGIRHMSDHHISYRQPQRGLLTELHWSFSENPAINPCPGQPPAQPAGLTELSARNEIATLPDADLMLYLCLHGASHSWMRLKWLADIAALVPQLPDLPAVIRTARLRGLIRPMAQMLYLLHDFLGWQMPEEVAASLPRDRAVQKLLDTAKKTLCAGSGAAEPRDMPFGTTRIYASRLLFSPSPAYLMHELPHLMRFFFSAENTPGVPGVLRPFFLLIRIPHWLIRNLVRKS